MATKPTKASYRPAKNTVCTGPNDLTNSQTNCFDNRNWKFNVMSELDTAAGQSRSRPITLDQKSSYPDLRHVPLHRFPVAQRNPPNIGSGWITKLSRAKQIANPTIQMLTHTISWKKSPSPVAIFFTGMKFVPNITTAIAEKRQSAW